jgi:hypothetical protein
MNQYEKRQNIPAPSKKSDKCFIVIGVQGAGENMLTTKSKMN